MTQPPRRLRWKVGAIHLQQYLKLYSAIPTIGTLFVLNFAAATVIGLGLIVPISRVAEGATVFLLGAFLAVRLLTNRGWALVGKLDRPRQRSKDDVVVCRQTWAIRHRG
jgi:hypothetical protein